MEQPYLQNQITSVALPGLLALLEAHIYHDFYRLGTNLSCSYLFLTFEGIFVH